MPKAYQSIRIFKSDTLEKLTHVHPITPLIIWVPVVLCFLYVSSSMDHLSVLAISAWAGTGLLIWTLFEYLLHRFIFHFEAHSRLEERLQYLIHGLHHDDPADPTRLVMPPVAAIVLALILYTAFRFALGAVFVHPFFAGFLAGYLCYDYIHYAIHHFTPQTRIGKFLKQSHMAHHYITHNARWGVSSPFWDYVFGTIEEVKADGKRVRHGS
jgi:sterol desaturase/sphingolipid hydroxylase (fatty acid hydroxylase superfamily)